MRALGFWITIIAVGVLTSCDSPTSPAPSSTPARNCSSSQVTVPLSGDWKKGYYSGASSTSTLTLLDGSFILVLHLRDSTVTQGGYFSVESSAYHPATGGFFSIDYWSGRLSFVPERGSHWVVYFTVDKCGGMLSFTLSQGEGIAGVSGLRGLSFFR